MTTISTSLHGTDGADSQPEAAHFAARRKPTYTTHQALRDLGVLSGRMPAIWSVWGRHSVAPAFREELMVSVAEFNGCRFCAFAHTEWALACVEQEDFDDGRWITYAWAHELVESGFSSASEDLEREMAARYTAHERRNLDTIVRVMTFMNLSGNTFDALLGRFRGRPVAGSRRIDELAVGGSFAAAILPVSLFLAVKRRKSPVRLARELSRFSARFDRSVAS